jgi:hypothetical protein
MARNGKEVVAEWREECNLYGPIGVPTSVDYFKLVEKIDKTIENAVRIARQR